MFFTSAFNLEIFSLFFCIVWSVAFNNELSSDDLKFYLGQNSGSRSSVVQIITHRREIRSPAFTKNPGQIDVTLQDQTASFDLKLRPNDQPISDDFKLVIRGVDGEIEREVSGKPTQSCLYTGKMKDGRKNSVVALSNCDGTGFKGMIFDGQNTHLIRPMSEQERNRRKRSANKSKDDMTEDGLHIIQTRDSDSKCAVHSLQAMMAPREIVELSDIEQERLKHEITKRQTEKKYTIETAVFTDGPMYDFIFEKTKNEEKSILDLETAVMSIMNGVNIIYKAPSMRTDISVVMVRLEIMKSSKKSTVDSAKGDIQLYLSNFCSWQHRLKKKLRRKGETKLWDHGLMLSGIDLWDIHPTKNKVIGLAWVGGMCNSFYSCTINEGTSFEAQFVIAHEIGHNLNLSHDGSMVDGNDCSDSSYLMSPSTGPGKLSWSVCSNRELEHFLTNSYNVDCLRETGSDPQKFGEEQNNKLPGQIYSISKQCTYALGEKFKPYVTSKKPYEAVCRELWCQNRTHAMRTHPALEGSTCANYKHCVGGACVKKLATFDPVLIPEADPTENEIPIYKPTNRKERKNDESDFTFKDLFKRIRNLFNKYLLISDNPQIELKPQWRLTNLTKCSSDCGGGWQTGVLICVNPAEEEILNHSQCDISAKVPLKTSCNTRPCVLF